MASRERLIARQLSGLSFIRHPVVHEEVRECIQDYFLDDANAPEQQSETDSNSGAEDCEPLLEPSLSTSLETSDADDIPRIMSNVGLHGYGDEGMLTCIAPICYVFIMIFNC